MTNLKRSFIAIYLDLENIPSALNIQRLMQDIIIMHETRDDMVEPVFAVKMACGNSSSISGLRGQLKEQNFEIRETPHLSRKKNRADLTITVAAFERLYLDNPTIDKFVFVTNDSDFTVIMDVLRKYGRQVWLVAQEQESKKEIFNSCSDNILLVEDYLTSPREPRNGKPGQRRQSVAKVASFDQSPDSAAAGLLKKVLLSLDVDRAYFNSQLGMKFRQLNKSFDMKKTTFKSFNKLVESLVQQDILAFANSDKDNIQVRIKNERRLEDI